MDIRKAYPKLAQPGRYSAEVEIDSLALAPDVYWLDIHSRSGDFRTLDYLGAAAQLEVIAGPNTPGYIIRNGAAVRLPSEWTWPKEDLHGSQVSVPTNGPQIVK
jgi:hypothetical protein